MMLRFGLRLVVLRHRDVVEGDVVVDDHLLVVEMVGDDADDVDRQRADLPAVEQVVEAMAEARHHQQHLHARVGIVDLGLHLELRRRPA